MTLTEGDIDDGDEDGAALRPDVDDEGGEVTPLGPPADAAAVAVAEVEPPPPATPAPSVAPVASVEQAALAAESPLAPAVVVDGGVVPLAAGTVPADVTPAWVPPRPPPPPRPPVVPERTADGWRTPGLELRVADSRGNYYVDVARPDQAAQRVYLAAADYRRLSTLARTPQLEAGLLWRRFCAIPLERPLPSRQLEEELRRILLVAAGEPI